MSIRKIGTVQMVKGETMRLIDADALKEYITKAYEEMKSEFKTDKYRDIAKLVTESFCMDIDEAPTVDAVEVVRCKDCKWFKTNYTWNGSECKVCGIEPYGSIGELDDFCSRGERKDDV